MRYPSDLTDTEWSLICDDLLYANGYGNTRIHDYRTVIDAIFYVVTTGCQWRMLPKEYPPWQSVYSTYRSLSTKGTWEKILHKLVVLNRANDGRSGPPSFEIMDSQSVKTTASAEERGIDGGKKIKGRKLHIHATGHF